MAANKVKPEILLDFDEGDAVADEDEDEDEGDSDV
jgi:hypothetical protein